jgi:exodeoxyribonuclease V beta subunit
VITPLDVRTCPLTGSALIEASAGTGKTWAICALYLRLLVEERLTVQQILVVTFTNAATAELRGRIRSRIAEALGRVRGQSASDHDGFVEALLERSRTTLGLPDHDLEHWLDSALQSFDEASIFTIHGFCKRALDDSPFVTGMPLSLEQISDDQDLLLEVARDFWRRRVTSSTLAPGLAAALGTAKDSPDKFAETLKRRIAKPLATLRWPATLDDPEAFDPAALEAAFIRVTTSWRRERDVIVQLLTDALPNLHAGTWKPAALKIGANSWDVVAACHSSGEIPETLAKLDLYSAGRIRSKAGRPAISPHPFFGHAQQLLAQLDARAAAGARARLRLLRDFLETGPAALAALKRHRRLVSYDDLLSNVHERLTSGRHAGFSTMLRERFPAALVDEFQDTDPLQFEIFRCVYAHDGARAFYVGDPKQAIYRFRNADLHVYLRARDQATRLYSLAENRRSTRGLIDALNALFGTNPRAFMLPGLEYQHLQFGERERKELASDGDEAASLHLWMLPGGRTGPVLDANAAREAAAAACASEIATLLRSSARLGDKAVAGGDIAVLVPTHHLGRMIRAALAGVGIGSVELSQESIFSSNEAEDLEHILAAILEPTQIGLLRAALATELMGYDAPAIERLAQDEAAGIDVVARFGDYRDTWARRGVGVMLQNLVAREDVGPRILSLEFGERRMTNLLHLTECLQGASAEHAEPDSLLRWLRTARGTKTTDETGQLRLESDRNLVQIATIHAAKGLEYPIVFCPFLWDEFLSSARIGVGTEYHGDDGGLIVDFDVAARSDTAIAAQLGLQKNAERIRLIYVALTRAVNRCYLVVGPYTKRGSLADCCSGTLNWLASDQRLSPQAWHDDTAAGRDVTSLWADWATRAGRTVRLRPLPSQRPIELPPQTVAANVVALPAPDSIGAGWRTGSYSSLAHGARSEALAADHDVGIAPSPEAVAAEEEFEPDDILKFPRGPVAGECLHALFESVDFTCSDGWPDAIDKALRNKPQTVADAATINLLPSMLARMLADVLSTRLPGGFRLGDIPPSRRLVELEFSLPVRDLSASALLGILRRHGYPVPRLHFPTLQGYLRGFIDLVFEHDGRYYVADWKSNYLGDSANDYADAPVSRAMAEHSYHLQFLLYTVAIHRYLAQRLIGYRYDIHFGGVLYLFVRGVRPAWRTDAGGPSGVFAHRPSAAVVEELASLMVPREGAT